MRSDFLAAFNQICSERGLSREAVLTAIEAALISAYKRSFGSAQNATAKIDPESGEAKIYVEKRVVEEVQDERFEISLEEAKKIDKDATLGGVVMIENTPSDFGRIAAQTAKQVILQRIREAERDALFNSYVERQGELINGTVQSITPQAITLNLGRTEAILPRSQQIPGERYHLNQRLRVYILEVRKSNRGPQIIVSRAHRNMLRRLLELEVPEIFRGTVEIKAIAREAGSRSKVAVAAVQEGIDPVGSCVGMRGVRIQNVVNELGGEKIDIVEWSPDTRTFIANALSPAKVVSVHLEEDPVHGKTATVIVPDDQLSLAIGKQGQNARLAAKLTGWRIDIKSVSEAAKEALRKAEEVPAVAAEQKDLLALAEEILRKGEARPTTEEIRVLERTIETVEAAVAEAGTPERMPLKELGLSTRVRRRLERAGITVVADLLERLVQGEEAMLTIPNFGPKSLAEVKEKLQEKGLIPVEEAQPAAPEMVEGEVPPEEAVAEKVTKEKAPIEEAEAEGAEELEPSEETAEEEIELKPKKKARPEKRILVYDEELGKVVAKRRRKPSRRREEWEEYND
ncbi:MAG TPA: transcription termination/antitermination protein NusA [Chloroflexi bacterium]|nr:transcription termination/antitermination protein NusA [Chloroflexota bacterium]